MIISLGGALKHVLFHSKTQRYSYNNIWWEKQQIFKLEKLKLCKYEQTTTNGSESHIGSSESLRDDSVETAANTSTFKHNLTECSAACFCVGVNVINRSVCERVCVWERGFLIEPTVYWTPALCIDTVHPSATMVSHTHAIREENDQKCVFVLLSDNSLIHTERRTTFATRPHFLLPWKRK